MSWGTICKRCDHYYEAEDSAENPPCPKCERGNAILFAGATPEDRDYADAWLAKVIRTFVQQEVKKALKARDEEQE